MKEPYTGDLRIGAISCRPFHADVGPTGLSLGIRIAIPPSKERSWPASFRTFYDFLREAATTSELPLEKDEDFSFFSRREVEPY